jgi:hypothetical protein
VEAVDRLFECVRCALARPRRSSKTSQGPCADAALAPSRLVHRLGRCRARLDSEEAGRQTFRAPARGRASCVLPERDGDDGARFTNLLSWELSDTAKLDNETAALADQERVRVNNDVVLMVRIIDQLSGRISFGFEYRSDTPDGTEHSDTTSRVAGRREAVVAAGRGQSPACSRPRVAKPSHVLANTVNGRPVKRDLPLTLAAKTWPAAA